MSNSGLTTEELGRVSALLDEIRRQIDELSDGDRELRFAYNRKLAKELTYDERGKPMLRRRLKRLEWEQQNCRCAACGEEMPLAYSVIDRFSAVDGYTNENTRLVHAACDYNAQTAGQYGNSK